MFMSALIHNYSLQLKNILLEDLFGFILFCINPTCRVAVQLALSAYDDSSQLQAGTEECYSLHLLCISIGHGQTGHPSISSRTVAGEVVRPTFPFSVASLHR